MQLKFLIRFGTLANLTHFKGFAAAIRAGGSAPSAHTVDAVTRHQLPLLILGHEVMLIEVRTVCAPPGIIFLSLFHIISSPLYAHIGRLWQPHYNVQFGRSQCIVEEST